jgi:hypothetical protein
MQGGGSMLDGLWPVAAGGAGVGSAYVEAPGM